MKKTNLLILLFTVIAFTAVSCGPKINNDDSDKGGMQFNLSNFAPLPDTTGATFNTTTHVFATTEKDSEIHAWLGQTDLSGYNCVKIKYSTDNYGFFFGIIYHTDSQGDIHDEYYCPSNLNEFIIPLQKERMDKIGNMYLRNIMNHADSSVTIKSITFLNRQDPGPSKTYSTSSITPVVDSKTDEEAEFDERFDAWDFLPYMGVGFQYTVCGGYTFGKDFGIDSSYAWGYPVETKETIQAIKAKGFNTLRLQVTAGNHMIDGNYTIDPAFMNQLKKVVDWAMEEDMFVIICDGLLYYYPADINEYINNWYTEHPTYTGYCINQRFKEMTFDYEKSFWSQIAKAFNNSYDEHLVFELLNEPIDTTDEHMFHPDDACTVCQTDAAILNNLNQEILNTIRSSGGNNKKRFLMIPNLAQDAWNAGSSFFEMPDDSLYNEKNKLILAVHNYPMGNAPGLQGDIKEAYTLSLKNERIVYPFEALDQKFFANRIPVAITETGCSRHTNIVERIYCMSDFMTEAKKQGRSCTVTLHDNCDYTGYDSSGNQSDFYGYFNKKELTWNDSEYIDTVIVMANGKPCPVDEDFINKNKIEYESLVGKEILEEPFNMGYWIFKSFKPDVFAKRIPEKIKLQLVFTKLPMEERNENDKSCSFHLQYPRVLQSISLVNSQEQVNGGKYFEDPDQSKNIKQISLDDSKYTEKNIVDDYRVIVSLSKEDTQNIECYGLYIQGGNMILKSLKVLSY